MFLSINNLGTVKCGYMKIVITILYRMNRINTRKMKQEYIIVQFVDKNSEKKSSMISLRFLKSKRRKI